MQRVEHLHHHLQRRAGQLRRHGGHGQLLQFLCAQRRCFAQAARAGLQHGTERACQRLRGLIAHRQRHLGHRACLLAQQMQRIAQTQPRDGLPQGFARQRAIDPMEMMRRLLRHHRQCGQIRQRLASANAGL
ncbi:hypothetical protein ASF73_02340 [Xanthomonas sp. Leaf131]|nr:hypothetical protein ASF73_02340 [Xanthomonas sp. Leaf131]